MSYIKKVFNFIKFTASYELNMLINYTTYYQLFNLLIYTFEKVYIYINAVVMKMHIYAIVFVLLQHAYFTMHCERCFCCQPLPKPA